MAVAVRRSVSVCVPVVERSLRCATGKRGCDKRGEMGEDGMVEDRTEKDGIEKG